MYYDNYTACYSYGIVSLFGSSQHEIVSASSCNIVVYCFVTINSGWIVVLLIILFLVVLKRILAAFSYSNTYFP